MPTHFIAGIFGTKRIDASSLTQFAMFKLVDYGHRNSPMPHMLESFYLKDRLRVGQTGLLLGAMVIAIVLGTVSGLFGNVQRGYKDTGEAWATGWAFQELVRQLRYPSGISYLYITYFLAGGSIITTLAVMSRRFIWWPFHPLGYIVGGEWIFRYLWFSIFLAWLIKWIILKLGGLDAHRKAVPFFVGVTVGDGVMLALWGIYGVVSNKWTLEFLYWGRR